MALEATRNMAIMKAREARFDFLCLTENDVLIKETTFTTMVKTMTQHKVKLLSPWYDQSRIVPADSSISYRLAMPNYAKGQGVQPVDWAVRSLVMWDCQAFDLLGETPYVDLFVYGVEEYHGMMFRREGVQWYVDTDEAVQLLRGPTPAWEFDFSQVRMPGNLTPEQAKAESAMYRGWTEQMKEQAGSGDVKTGQKGP